MGISNISSSGVRKTKGKSFANSRGVVGQGSGGDNSYKIEEDGIFYRVHEFTSSGTFSVQADAEYRVLVIAGGGANAQYGGGGAGGMQDRFLDLTAGDITVTVGAAGVGGNGGSSSFGSHISCSGGGWGGANQRNGYGGGSGGGGGSSNNNTGTGQGGGTGMGTIAPDQGTSGGRGYGCCPGNGGPRRGGGGGGAGTAGGAAAAYVRGVGGDGRISNITGSEIYYAGGNGSPNGLGQENYGGGGAQNGVVIVRYRIS